MKVYLVDYIGMHCGMHYYNDAFAGFCLQFRDWMFPYCRIMPVKTMAGPFFYTSTRETGCAKYVVCCGTT